jgi:hypothetical protein
MMTLDFRNVSLRIVIRISLNTDSGIRMTGLDSDLELTGRSDWTRSKWNYGKDWTRICPTEVRRIGSRSWIKPDGIPKSVRNQTEVAWNRNPSQCHKTMIGFIGSYLSHFLVCCFEILLSSYRQCLEYKTGLSNDWGVTTKCHPESNLQQSFHLHRCLLDFVSHSKLPL